MRSGRAEGNAGDRASAQSSVAGWDRWGLVLLSLALLTGALLVPPRSPLGKCDLVGYALCHRIPSHSFDLAGHGHGRQLPLCARCTGTYLGALWGLLSLGVIGRRRPGRLPPIPILALLIGFFLLQAVDGLNSTLTLFPALPQLYEPHNLLRFAIGALNGLTMSALMIPLLNSALWRAPDPEPAIRGSREMGALLIGVGGLVALISADFSLLLYPLAVGSALSVVLILTLVNTTIVIMATGREGMAESWAQAWAPLLVGLDLSLLEMGALVLLRGLVTQWLGFPLSSVSTP